MQTAILAADEFELQYINENAFSKVEIRVSSVGVGLCQSAIGAERVLRSGQPDCAIFVGTCGSNDPRTVLLDLINVDFAALGDLNLTRNDSYLPSLVPQRYEADPALVNRLASKLGHSCFSGGIYSPLSISRKHELGGELSLATGAAYENLELFSVAAVANDLSIPWGCISCVSNYVGAEAHQQWLENRRAAARKTADALLQFLE